MPKGKKAPTISHLLKEIIAQHPGELKGDLEGEMYDEMRFWRIQCHAPHLIGLSQSTLSDQLDDLGKLVFLLQDLLGLGAVVRESWPLSVVIALKEWLVLGIGDAVEVDVIVSAMLHDERTMRQGSLDIAEPASGGLLWDCFG
jgi:hypothetical protein